MDVRVRFLADSAQQLAPEGEDVTDVPAGGSATLRFAWPESPLPLFPPLLPIGFVAVRWSRKPEHAADAAPVLDAETDERINDELRDLD